MHIYFSNINNLTAARFGAAQGFFALSFNLDAANPHYLGYQGINEIAAWTSGSHIAGAFAQPVLELVNDAIALTHLEIVEIPADGLTVAQMQQIRAKIMLRTTLAQLPTLPADVLDYAHYILIYEPHNHWQAAAQNQYLQAIAAKKMVFLHINFFANEAKQIKNTKFNLCLVAESEEAVGIKNFDDLNEIIDALQLS
jgi:hypothetical protein